MLTLLNTGLDDGSIFNFCGHLLLSGFIVSYLHLLVCIQLLRFLSFFCKQIWNIKIRISGPKKVNSKLTLSAT